MRVVVFGTFDPLHAGHKDFFQQALAHGSSLIVVVARDSWVRANKGKEPRALEEKRQAVVAQLAEVDQAVLGDDWPTDDPYRLLDSLSFEVVALGYDQLPSAQEVREELDCRGKVGVKVVRLEPFKPELYKSSYV